MELSQPLYKNKLTPADIEAVIKEEKYSRIADTTVTLCCLILINGFAVIGESSCVDPAEFDPYIGRDLARQRALDKVWELEGYLLKQSIFMAEQLRKKHEQQVKDSIVSVEAVGGSK